MNHEQLSQQNAERMDKLLRQLSEEQQRIKEQRNRVRRFRRQRKIRMIEPFITLLCFTYYIFSFVFMDFLWFINLEWSYRAAYMILYLCLLIPWLIIDDKK